MAEVKGCNRLAPVRSPGAAAPFKAVTPFRRAAGVHAHVIPCGCPVPVVLRGGLTVPPAAQTNRVKCTQPKTFSHTQQNFCLRPGCPPFCRWHFALRRAVPTETGFQQPTEENQHEHTQRQGQNRHNRNHETWVKQNFDVLLLLRADRLLTLAQWKAI